MRFLSPLFAIICIGALVACTSGDQAHTLSAASPEGSGLATELGSNLPALSELKTGTVLVPTFVAGADTLARGGDATDNGFSLFLASGTGELSWGLWQLNSAGTFESTLVVQSISDGNETWLALANFTDNRWDVTGPYTNDIDLPLDPTHNNDGAGNLFIAVLTFDGKQATVIDITLRADDGNLAPTAVLSADGLTEVEGNSPLNVIFDASGSSDSDGTIVDYEWDFNGDGVFSDTVEETSAQGLATSPDLEFTAGPLLNVSVRVTDDMGASDVASVPVTIHGWANQELDTAGSVGQHTSLAIVAGNPAVSYYDLANGNDGNLKYVRALDASGTIWGAPLPVDSDAGSLVGQYNSLALVDGNPAISYWDATNDTLKYVRALDSTGGSWSNPITLDADGTVGQYTSLAVVNGKPAISYFDYNNGDLKYIRAQNAAGSNWGEIGGTAVDSDGIVGLYTSLTIVDSHPAISYLDFDSSDLMFVRAEDSSGSNWGTPLAVDSEDLVGYFSSLTIVDGSPAICYRDNTFQDLKYVRASDAVGSTWNSPARVVTEGSAGDYCSLAVVGGLPAISFYNWGDSDLDLNYVEALDASGDSWGTPVVVDSAGIVGRFTSLVDLNGKPAISYYDDTNSSLKYANLY